MNYDFSQKRHWRRSLWNCIGDRVQTAKRDAIVLYLAGGLDQDRPVALAKGFRSENLIAIEHDEETAQQLRQRGTLTLLGDAFAHALAWNPKRHIDVCVLDLCGGLTQRTAESIETMLALPHFANAVIAVNMLRGRDAAGNELRNALATSQRELLQESLGFESRAVQLGVVSQEKFSAMLFKALGGGPMKHRGSLLQSLIMRNWMAHCLLVEGAVDEHLQPTEPNERSSSAAGTRFVAAIQRAKFQTLSYRSTAHQTFDTLVFCNSLAAGNVHFSLEATAIERSAPGLVQHRQQQAAILAHRTRRAARP